MRTTASHAFTTSASSPKRSLPSTTAQGNCHCHSSNVGAEGTVSSATTCTPLARSARTAPSVVSERDHGTHASAPNAACLARPSSGEGVYPHRIASCTPKQSLTRKSVPTFIAERKASATTVRGITLAPGLTGSARSCIRISTSVILTRLSSRSQGAISAARSLGVISGRTNRANAPRCGTSAQRVSRKVRSSLIPEARKRGFSQPRSNARARL